MSETHPAVNSAPVFNTAEELRLEAVERYRDFDLYRKKELRDILMVASYICQSPIALVTLMDRDIQWIKSQIGVDLEQMPRETSFCTRAIETDDITVVDDALLDPRFADLPVVKGEPHIRFYASANLRAEGYNVGTLCVYDVEPKTLSDSQRGCLEVLARQVSYLMELDKSLQTLKHNIDAVQQQKFETQANKLKLRAMLNSSTTLHILFNNKMKVLAYNKGVEDLISQAMHRDIREGDHADGYFSGRYRRYFHHNFERSIRGENIKTETLAAFGDSEPNWWELTFTPAYNSFNEIIGVSLHAINIHDRKVNEQKIEDQNKALRDIAFFQSHELRSDVSSIQGILALLRDEDSLKDHEYLRLMNTAVDQLDEKIRKVVERTG